MEADSVDDAAEWDVVPVGRGHDGLRALAAGGFSGGVTDGRVWAMLTNGRVVGVVGGDVDDLADADLTAHEAPDPALPLLLVMREQSTEPRAQYYTEETPLREVDERLREGGFTGFVELAENVLSGDYYLVYYGGERMPLAFVGGSRRLETGEETFDRAAGEVGIYGVYAADVSVVNVPGGETSGAVGAAGASERSENETAAAGEDETSENDETTAPTADEDESSSADATEPAEDEDAPETEPDAWNAEAGDGVDTESEEDVDAEDDAESEEDVDAESEDGDTDAESDEAPTPTNDPDVTVASVETDRPETDSADGDVEETTPDESGDEQPGEAVDTTETTDDELAANDGAVVEDDADGAVAVATDDGVATTAAAGDEATEERIAALRDERDELRERVETLTAERDELRAELERAERERETLRERLNAAGATEGEALSPAAALSGTNLFVRYRSKAEPTLDRALDDGTDREAVDENLLLERHTTFETEDATVGGRPYDEFLASTLQYRFVEWLVRALPFELRDAAGKRPLGRLYKAIPSFDRAEIDGTVAVLTDEGEAKRSFDVVVRDRKGAPLAVASLFDGREPATEEMLSELVADARAAAAANESLGAAVFVTTSYYAPEALELAEAETRGGGLFGRGSRESYVRLDRSHGFHLCLVEARDDDFHLGVPDL